MRLALLFGVFLVSTSLAAEPVKPAAEAPRGKAAYMLLTEGIVGGFVPAHIRQQTVILRRGDECQILVMRQPSRGAEQTFHSGKLMPDQFARLQETLAERGLWKLPLEIPTGCQDIYGLDTSLAVRQGDRFWRNGGPGGCVHGESKVQPSDEQRKAFASLVAVVKEAAEKLATEKTDAESFSSALLAVQKDGEKAPTKGGSEAPARLQFK